MLLRDEILRRVEMTRPELILASMGCSPVQPDDISLLKAVLSDPLLGLAIPGPTLKARTTSCCRCALLGMDRSASAIRIGDIIERLRIPERRVLALAGP